MLTYADVCSEAERDKTTTFKTYVSMRQHTSAYVSIRRTSHKTCTPFASASIRPHTSAYVSIRQHTSAYVSIRQHTSAYVSIRLHMPAYVSIRQHTYPIRLGKADDDFFIKCSICKCADKFWRMLTYADVC